VQGRDVEVVVCVMALCQTAREIALVMVEDVGQVSQAVATRILCQSLFVDPLTQQIPDRLGTVLVAVVGKVLLEVGYQIFVQRDGHSLHLFSPVADSIRTSGCPHEFWGLLCSLEAYDKFPINHTGFYENASCRQQGYR